MNTNHRQNIETAWDNLLEAVSEAAQEACADTSKPIPGQKELSARLETLHAALRGLGNAWTRIRDMLPVETEDREVTGALPQSAYCKPLARTLLSLGGQAATDSAISEVGRLLEERFNAADREPLPKTGQIRWMVNVRFARLQLKNIGLIRADTHAGRWELTEAGKRWAESDMVRLPNPVPQPDPNQQLLPF